MKKRSLFKRLLSGVVATALAATICFGDRAFSDLFASAVGETQTVNVNFVDNGEAKPYDSHENGMRYFVLGALVDKDAGPKIAATADYEDQIVAWDCKEITPNTDAQSTVSFDEFYENDNDHTKFDRDQKKIKFDADKYKFITRVYRYWVNKTQYGGTSPSENPHSTKGVEPTNLIAPEKGGFWYSEPYQQPAYYVEQSSDTFPNYIPSNSKEGNTTTVEFDKHHNEFGIVVNFSKPTTIKADEYYYIVVEVEHQNHDKTYFYTNLTANNANSVEYTVQKGDVRKWMTAGGVINPNEQYHGNELSTKVRLFKATAKRELTPLLNGEGCVEIKTGDFAKAQKVDIKELTVDEQDAVNTKYYETINFLKADESDKYTYKDILGSGIAFGLTADRFALNNHAQTNFAVNYYRDLKKTLTNGNGQNNEPDLASPATEMYIANFAELSKKPAYLDKGGTEISGDPTNITIDPYGKVTVGDPKNPMTIHLEDKNRANLLKSDLITLDDSKTGAQIKADVVDPIIAQMQAMSNRLASKEANITVVHAESRFNVNTLDYDDDATIYVDGDALAKDGVFSSEDIFKFIKKENQTIVINFKNTKKAVINTFETTVVDKDGNVLFDTMDSSPDGEPGSARNQFLNKQIMRRIVWNLNSVENTDEEFKADEACVTIRNTAGLFLIPNAKTVTKVPSTSTGWLISAGYVENNGGEWHFPYDELEPFKKPETTDIVISKKAITGEDEIKGATLQIVDKVTGKNIGDSIWKQIVDENEGVTALTTDIGVLKDVRYGMQWTSGDTAKTITLRDGSYVLKESGTTFTSGGKTYNVVSSSFEFEITNGKITKVSKDVEENNGSIKYTDTNNTITIRDAQVGGPKTYPVHINKTDVTGQKELAGATLTVYKKGADGQLEKVNDVNNPWRSEDGKELTLALEDGNYVLKETGTTVTDADNNTYKVLDTNVEFTISNGVVTNSSANVKDDFAKVDKKNGGAVAQVNKSGEAVITVCDAINTTTVTLNKTDITGEKELTGAVLTIKQGNTVIKEWTSKPGEKMTVTLDDGTYTLTEEAAKDTSGKPINVVDANGKTYDIVKSVVEFTVRNGAVVSSTNTVSRVDNVDQTTGGVVLSGTEFTVCDAANKTPVTLNKTDITGDKELDGAILTIKQGDNVIATWESKKGETKTVSLEDGTYTLTETGTNVTDGTNNYKVHNTALEFTVTNGTVTADKAKTEFDSNATEGYFVAKGANLTVCDVVIPKHEIVISKTDISGQKEIDGAVLTIKDSNKNTVAGPWTSKADGKGGNVLTVTLEDGEYTLTETGDTVTDADGNTYKILTSEIKFTVADGKVTSTSAGVVDDIKKVDAANGGVVANGTANLTICDAVRTVKVTISKTDVTGQAEVKGAKLILKDSTDKQVGDTWVSGGENGSKWEVSLAPGKYTLTEAPDSVVTDENNKQYQVITSTYEFEVGTDGKVKQSKAIDTTEGTISAEGNVITVVDAIAPEKTTPVHINKTDITGQKELAGATLTVYKKGADNQLTKVEDAYNPWVSTADAQLTLALTDGNYVLKETGTTVTDADGKTYKILATDVEFTVTNGTVSSRTAKTSFADMTTEGAVLTKDAQSGEYTLTICDAANKTPVTLNKTDITGDKELDGAILTIKQGDNVIATWESKKGETKTVSLEDGTYTLTETGTNVTDGTNNYKVHNTALEFTVTNGTVTADKAKTEFDSNATEGYFVAKGANLTVCDVVIPKHEIVISKTDISGQKEIAGAVLTIKDSNKNTVAGPWTSKADGKGGNVLTVTLEDGEYTLTETGDTVTDADGNTYKILTSEIKFTVADGKVTSTSAGVVDDIKKVDAANGGVVANGTANLTICDAVKTVKVTISKTDVTGQAEVKGAKLILKDSTDTQVGDTWVSGGENGSKWEVSLAPGKYTLTEAPDSVVTDENNKQYQVITSTYEFEVGTDGKVKDTRKVESDEGTISAGEGNVIKVVDALVPTKTPVHINKTDITGQKELAGATLTVYKKGADNQLTKVEDAYNPWVSAANAQLTLQLFDGDYVLRETGTNVTDADGNTYTVLATDVEFTVTNGTVSSRTAKTNFADMTTEGAVLTKDAQSGEYTLTICDAVKTVKVTISKTDVTGQKEVKGAKLIVKDNSGRQVGETWVSGGENGSKFEISLAPGKYTLTEAPDSTVTDDDGNEYQVITTVYEFEVGTDGKVKESKKVETNEGSITAGEGNVITVVDAIAPAKTTYVHINKTDITGQKELTGATLTVYSVGADNKLTKVEDANNPWQSAANAQLTLALEDGTYELKETGTTVTDADGKTYKILATGVEFTVSNGTVSSRTAKTSFADMTTEGAVLTKDAQSGEYTLTICDAANKTPVTLNKTDITGQKELAGAKLTIKQGETTVAEWVSVIGQTKTVELEDGTYTLEETGTKITDNDGNLYDVMPSKVTFTVSGGTVTSTDAKASFNDVGENGGAVLNEKTLTICDAKTVIPKYPVKINKTDVTGEKELTGATLTVKQGDKVIDSWTSKPNETMELELEDGDYTLTESGNTVTDANGKTYKILGSTIGFTVTNGTVTSRGAKTTFDDVDKTTGGVVVKNNVITVCDAANVTKVIINKTDVTGEKELTGAVITVKQGETVIKEWTSKPNETMELELEDGDYSFTETGREITDADGKTYKVIGSEVKFTVQNGTVTSKDAKTTFDDVDKTTGGVVVTGTHITISDAANVTPVVLNKTDITGDKELAGATLTIKQGTKTVASWVSVIGETKTVELEDGDYSLTESGDEVKDADGKTYKVLTTVLDFTVKNGTVSSTAAKTAFNKDATGGYVVLQNNKLTVCDVMELIKVKLNKTDITGDNELAGATLTIKQGTKTVASWVSVIGDTYEVELEDGEYTLTESGTTVTDAQGVKYDVMTSTVTFTVSGGKVTSQTVRTDFDATAQTGYVVLKNKTELTVCDVKKTQGNVSSSGSQQSNPSMSVSSPQVSSQPSGNVSSGQSQPSVPSQSVSIPSQSVSVPSQSNSTPVSTVKPNTPSDSNSSSISQNSSSKTSESSKGNGTTTKKSSNGQPPVTTTTGNGGNPPQTGHSGSTVTVAALLAAVAALAVLKKKNDD